MPLARLWKSAALSAAALVGLGLASSAQAQQTGQTGVDRVRITMDANEWHQVAEFLAFEEGSGTNVASQANGGVATASSSGFGTIPGDANDANTDGNYGNGSLWHSGVDPAGGATVAVGQFVEIDFSSPRTINSIQVFGRTDCCQNRDTDLSLQLYGENGALLQEVQFGIPDDDQEITIPITAIPEPASLGVLAVGGLALLARRRSRAAR
jgi:hypothetical protein